MGVMKLDSEFFPRLLLETASMSAVGMMQGWQKVTKVRLSVSELSAFIRHGDMVEKHLLDQDKYHCLEQQ